jgi:hypothetical protein
MPIKNNSKSSGDKSLEELEKELATLAKKSEVVFSDFIGRLNELRQVRRRLVDNILKRQDEEKISDILKQIK